VPQGDAHPRQQLTYAEGLAHVVIGTSVQCGNLIPFLAPGRQDDDRDGAPFSEPPDNLEPVHIREAEIENHHVGLSGGRFNETCPSRNGLKEAVSPVPQGRAEEALDLRIVFDDKDGWFRA
jgi:hypothetical protein